mgnify:CR=1 FL=1
MVVGLIVLFSLINLVIGLGKTFSLQQLMLDQEMVYPETSDLVTVGLKLRQAGEDKVGEMITPVLEGKIEESLRKIIGVEGIKVKISSSFGSEKLKARVILSSDPGFSAPLLKGIVSELLRINPDQVEVEKEFDREE